MAEDPQAPPAPPSAPGATTDVSVEDLVRQEASKAGIPRALALAVAEQESGFNPTLTNPQAVNGEHATGTFQLLPSTAKMVNPQLDLNNPQHNIQLGVGYLRQLMDQHQGDMQKVLANYGGVRTDTTYVPQVLARLAKYQQSEHDGDTPQAGPPPRPPYDPGWEAQNPVKTILASMINNEPPPPQATPGEAAIYRAGAGTAKFLRESTTSLRPDNIAKGIGALFTTTESPTEKTLTLDPRPALHAMWDANAKLRDEGRQLMDQARGTHDFSKSLEGLGRIAEGMVPVFGPRLAEADKWARAGEYARAAGAATDVAGQIFGPKLLEDSQVTPRVFKPRLTEAEQAAVDLGLRSKVPVDVATASGSDFARGTQRSVESTPLGGIVHETVKYGRKKALPALGEDLASGVHPVPVTPEQSGAGIRSSVENYIADQHAAANTHYDTLRQIEASAPPQQVQIGTTNQYTSSGTLQTVPIMGPMQLPADLTAAKAALRPLLDRYSQLIGTAQQDASPGLRAIKQIVDGPDYMPASQLDQNLSVIKGLGRGADMPQLRNVSQGLAAQAVRELETAHATALAQAGPAAQQAMTAGRAATAAKYAAQDVLDKITRTDEPVRAFNAATVAGDAAIDHLRDLQRLAPNEIPKMGRAVLESLFDRAGGLEKGWGRADSVANRWDALGPQTKQILYGNRAADLDSFFLLQKMLARSPNPSGTALTLLTAGSGYAMASHPLASSGLTLGSGAMAALMNSRIGVRLLTQGLTIPAGGAQALAWATAVGEQLRKMHQDVGMPPPVRPTQVAQPPPAPPPPR